MPCQRFRWQLFIYQAIVLPWSWQSCSRCEGHQESHILIKDQRAKNKTAPACTALRDSRRCEKALQCTRSNYHAYTVGLLLCINVSWTGFLLRKPLAGKNVPQCTWSLSWSQDWQQESHTTTEVTSPERKHRRQLLIVCVPSLGSFVCVSAPSLHCSLNNCLIIQTAYKYMFCQGVSFTVHQMEAGC